MGEQEQRRERLRTSDFILYKRERATHCECACFVHEIREMWGIWGCAWFGFGIWATRRQERKLLQGFGADLGCSMIHSRVVRVVEVLSMYKR